MEDSLGQTLAAAIETFTAVLILVVMEDSLGLKKFFLLMLRPTGLNPCCNGR